MNNPEGLPSRNTVIRRRCACRRWKKGQPSGDPRPARIASSAAGRVDLGWVKLNHCEPACRLVHLVWQFQVGLDCWQRHMGLFTLREADDLINVRPDGPTGEDFRKAWGA